jgi:glutathione synthase/RimK-type ligase-like ATP-grasp enzyme
MKQIANLDILIVYNSTLALSAAVPDSVSMLPFPEGSVQANYNLSYAYFLQTCAKRGLTAGFAASNDVSGPGQCKHYWTFHNNAWQKHLSPAFSTQIFDKLSPSTAASRADRDLLLSEMRIQPFNDRSLFMMFYDKTLTYEKLAPYTIPTTHVLSSHVDDITAALERLSTKVEEHAHSEDFSPSVILKDRFGAGGNYVFKVTKDYVNSIHTLMEAHPTIQFIIQPFLLFDHGFLYKNQRTSTDLRLIFLQDKMIQAYVRLAKGDDFRCNAHQGATLEYVSSTVIPSSVKDMAKEIVSVISKPLNLYALDFVVSNAGNTYMLEGNCGPGVNWSTGNTADEKKSKQLMDNIISVMALKAKKTKRLQKIAPTLKFPLPLSL